MPTRGKKAKVLSNTVPGMGTHGVKDRDKRTREGAVYGRKHL